MDDSIGYQHIFTFHYSAAERPEMSVLRFCELNNIFRKHCGDLFHELLHQLRKSVAQSPHLIDSRFENSLHPFLVKNVESFDNQRTNNFVRIDCGHLNGDIVENNEFDIENTANDFIFNQFQSAIEQKRRSATNCSTRITPRVCFVHSCLLPNRSTDILENILRLIYDSALAQDLLCIWVINHGEDITSHASYASLRANFPKVTFIQRTSDTSRFEIPTLRHLHAFASRFEEGRLASGDYDDEEDVMQVLYLHTKGVSYKKSHVGVVDWTNMMLYFMVEQHRRCFHLLASGEFDAIGTNCHPEPSMHFAGNMWWATATYLSRCAQRIFARY